MLLINYDKVFNKLMFLMSSKLQSILYIYVNIILLNKNRWKGKFVGAFGLLLSKIKNNSITNFVIYLILSFCGLILYIYILSLVFHLFFVL